MNTGGQTLAIISQNIASEKLNTSYFTPDIPHELLVVCQQEVKSPYNPTIVSDYYISTSELTPIADVFLNNPNAKIDKNLRMIVYSRNHRYIVKTGTIPIANKAGIKGAFAYGYQTLTSSTGNLTKTAGYSKGAVWATLEKNGTTYLFVNAHLPMDKKAPGLGVDYRTKAFKTILTKLAPLVTANTYIFFMGDLNFRMDEVGRNQLNPLLEQPLPISLTDISPTSGQSYTCKFIPTGTKDCRLQEIEPGVPPKDPTCFDNERIPSRCDRILVGDNNLPILDYKTFVLDTKFDHNGIYATFELSHIKSKYLSSMNHYGPRHSHPKILVSSTPVKQNHTYRVRRNIRRTRKQQRY